ncbi:metallophosphoesterase [Paenibacillus doosanensis]|uniref:3',5'-cyclic adenosine monophosphate phosphodiesterase CpdA n=1 Tax=Paenibacillus konkukensis TaxID=2020716 RepID=A0ABY4RMX3_9BACL|nr:MULTISPECIES: metallophosphoesterase [Paenibacillus]MCS7460676.1 metallophosphoesterase [Paenibacillus doosanensis]UQZ82657.1 3',5'-cyclic adenosine monophosphate phosphodiesterase CpdA [Paenibacillus konkukensis]
MNRRGFLKWLFSMGVVVDGSINILLQMLYQVYENASKTGTETQEAALVEKVEPALSNEPLLSFFVLSDMHISIYDPNTPRKFRSALEQIVQFESPVDALLLGGDLTDYGTEAEYKSLENIMSGFKLPPFYANMGNHDYYHVWMNQKGAFSTETMPNGWTDAQSRARFMKLFGYTKPYNAVTINGYHIILLSQETYRQEMPEVGEGAWYSDAQLEWFQKKLAETTDGKPIFVLIHQPLPPEGKDGGTHQLIRAGKFRELLAPYPNVFVISGHTHQDFDNGSSHYSEETFHWFVNASVGMTRDKQNPASKSQGMYVQVYADRVVVRGREFAQKRWIPEADWMIPLKRV